MNPAGVFVRELTFEIESDLAAVLDSWLSGFTEDVSELPGVLGVSSWAVESGPETTTRVVLLKLDQDALFQAGGADPDPRAELEQLFGARVRVSERALRGAASDDSDPTASCLNCNAFLSGQYCAACGQRANGRLITIPELIRDAFGDLFELDSRFWRTMVPLAIRPGRLTRDYLRGRRARYMPPFRMYLVLSLLFFLVAFFDPQERLGILFTQPPATTENTDGQALPEGLDELAVTPGTGRDANNPDCDFEDYDPDELPNWLSKRITKDRLTAACENVFSDDGRGERGFIDRMVENIPVGLFLLLPLMALILMVLHPLSGRYYVEHLLFVIHYHSFVFLILGVDALISRLATASTLSDTLAESVSFAAAIYVPVYLYKALRRVYSSGHGSTTLRFLLLLLAYLTGLGIIVSIAALIAAFSI